MKTRKTEESLPDNTLHCYHGEKYTDNVEVSAIDRSYDLSMKSKSHGV